MKKPKDSIKKIIDKDDYAKRVVLAKQILSGKSAQVISELRKEMQRSSEIGFYEHALVRRNQIRALEALKEKQVMELKKNVDANIINYVIDDEKMHLLVFNIRKGILEGKQKFVFDYRKDIFEEFLTQFYSNNLIPNQIILPRKVDPSIKDYLEKIKGYRVRIIVPQRGESKKLLDLVKKNVLATFFSGLESIIDLKQSLRLKNLPKRIECFDISHLSGTLTVASMVTFVDGKMDKSSYRRFRIRSETNADDFAAMHEVITRRYSKTLKDSMPDPDLIVIDGGIGQLNIAKQVLDSLGLEIEIISLAKRLEEIYLPGVSSPISLPRKSKGLLMLRAIRDEAHRFAISYNRLLRSKNLKPKKGENKNGKV